MSYTPLPIKARLVEGDLPVAFYPPGNIVASSIQTMFDSAKGTSTPVKRIIVEYSHAHSGRSFSHEFTEKTGD